MKKKFLFTLEVMGKEVYVGEWETETLQQAEEEIDAAIDLSIIEEEGGEE